MEVGGGNTDCVSIGVCTLALYSVYLYGLLIFCRLPESHNTRKRRNVSTESSYRDGNTLVREAPFAPAAVELERLERKDICERKSRPMDTANISTNDHSRMAPRKLPFVATDTVVNYNQVLAELVTHLEKNKSVYANLPSVVGETLESAECHKPAENQFSELKLTESNDTHAVKRQRRVTANLVNHFQRENRRRDASRFPVTAETCI